jgi:hypothetical protein
MGHGEIALGRNTSAFLVALSFTGVVLVGCGNSDPAPAPGTAGSVSQSGSGGSTSSTTAGAGGTGGTGGGGGGQVSTGGSAGTGQSTGGQSGSGSGGMAGTTAGTGGSAGSGGSSGSGGSGGAPAALDKFSFFVTSMKAMRQLSGSQDGFGGDLRYGTGDGLMGADKICTEIAESSMPGSGAKQWRAFLSTVKGPVHAKDRIGQGPWYDRTGRVVAMTLQDLLQNRPNGADAMIKEDLPNETGTPNHRPDPNAPADDNHHTLTGSDDKGMLYGNTSTCMDWTTSSRENQTTGRPRIGFCWSIQNRTNWISGQDEGGCGAGVTGVGTVNGGSTPSNPIVGSGGGYGAIYCFALTP